MLAKFFRMICSPQRRDEARTRYHTLKKTSFFQGTRTSIQSPPLADGWRQRVRFTPLFLHTKKATESLGCFAGADDEARTRYHTLKKLRFFREPVPQFKVRLWRTGGGSVFVSHRCSCIRKKQPNLSVALLERMTRLELAITP